MTKIAKMILNFENYYLRDEISYEDIRHGILNLITYTVCKKTILIWFSRHLLTKSTTLSKLSKSGKIAENGNLRDPKYRFKLQKGVKNKNIFSDSESAWSQLSNAFSIILISYLEPNINTIEKCESRSLQIPPKKTHNCRLSVDQIFSSKV